MRYMLVLKEGMFLGLQFPIILDLTCLNKWNIKVFRLALVWHSNLGEGLFECFLIVCYPKSPIGSNTVLLGLIWTERGKWPPNLLLHRLFSKCFSSHMILNFRKYCIIQHDTWTVRNLLYNIFVNYTRFVPFELTNHILENVVTKWYCHGGKILWSSCHNVETNKFTYIYLKSRNIDILINIFCCINLLSLLLSSPC